MRIKPMCHLLLIACMLGGCGVPRASIQLCQQEATLQTTGLSDEEIAAALHAQADQWLSLSTLLQQQEPGGILFVDQGFVELVQRTASAAARIRTLMDAGEDDPALRRDLLAAFQALWAQAESYLGQ